MLLRIITQISRIFSGLLFIISGLIKANDPIGFGIKLKEYFEVFTLDLNNAINFSALDFIANELSIFICIFEIVLGITLLLGYKKKTTLYLLLAMIVFFTFLTFYSALFNKVTDCGCFGDALKLTPWESFGKDILLLVLILIMLVGSKYIKPIANNKTLASLTILGTFLSLLFSVYTYSYLPIIDFRPYKIGNNIYELSQIPADAPKPIIESIFIYEKDGVKKEFKLEELTDDVYENYKYVDRKDKVIQKGYEPPIHDFALIDDNDENKTDSFFNASGYRLLIVAENLSESNASSLEKIGNNLSSVNVPTILLTSTSAKERSEILAKHGINIPSFLCDQTTLKTMIRSNPGYILMKENVVMAKYSKRKTPTMEDLSKSMAK